MVLELIAELVIACFNTFLSHPVVLLFDLCVTAVLVAVYICVEV
jgi:hypothetical protein